MYIYVCIICTSLHQTDQTVHTTKKITYNNCRV